MRVAVAVHQLLHSIVLSVPSVVGRSFVNVSYFLRCLASFNFNRLIEPMSMVMLRYLHINCRAHGVALAKDV